MPAREVKYADVKPSPARPGNVVVNVDDQVQEVAASSIKLVMFFPSADGNDSFLNETKKTFG